MKKKKKEFCELSSKDKIKEVNRRIRLARYYWDKHRNKPCRRERDAALLQYTMLSEEEKNKIPQELRVWLRYRSEKYFGEQRTKPGIKK